MNTLLLLALLAQNPTEPAPKPPVTPPPTTPATPGPQDAPEGETLLAERTWIAFRDGNAVEAAILEVKGDRIVARIPAMGILRAEIPLARLSSASAYRILRESEDLDSVEALVRVAELAAESGLHRQAADDLQSAIDLNPENVEELRAKLQEVRAEGAQAALERAQRLEELGENDAARGRYRDLLRTWPDAEAAGEATARLEALDAAAAERDAARAEAVGASERTTDAREEGRFARVYDLLDRGRKAYQSGLEKAEDLGDSEDDLLDAANRQERALRRLDAIATEEGLDQADPNQLREDQRLIEERLRRLQDLAAVHLLETRIALGHHFIAAGDTLEAHRYAALAQSVDPESPRVLNLLQSVAAASARDRRGR